MGSGGGGADAEETGGTRVVSGVSLTVNRGETVGVVGESGSGKSMTSLAILRLLPEPGARDARDHPLRRARPARPSRKGDADRARRTYRDDFSGPDDKPQSRLHGRRSDRRGGTRPPSPPPRRGVAGGDRRPRARSRHAARAARPAVPTRAIGRYAAARNDRDGARLPARSAPSPTNRRPRST